MMLFDVLEEAFSKERLSTFLRLSEGRRDEAARLYTRNIRLSTSLYPLLQTFELLLRNRMNVILTQKFGPDWFWSEAILAGLDDVVRSGIKETPRQNYLNQLKKTVDKHGRGDLLPNLTFGWWKQLFNRHHNELWDLTLHRILPQETRRDSNRRAFLNILNEANDLRNRIAHHEPIVDQSLEMRYRKIRDVLTKMSEPVSIWLNEIDRFEAELRRDNIISHKEVDKHFASTN
ncbi:hypothetical protein [Sorlinia euscelidii]